MSEQPMSRERMLEIAREADRARSAAAEESPPTTPPTRTSSKVHTPLPRHHQGNLRKKPSPKTPLFAPLRYTKKKSGSGSPGEPPLASQEEIDATLEILPPGKRRLPGTFYAEGDDDPRAIPRTPVFGDGSTADAVEAEQKSLVDRVLEAVSAQNREKLISLIRGHGHDLNHPGNNGHLPLVEAVRSGWATGVKLLVACNGVDLEARDEAGMSALKQSVISNRGKIFPHLMSRINMGQDDDQLSGLLELAVDHGSDNVVAAWLTPEAGAPRMTLPADRTIRAALGRAEGLLEGLRAKAGGEEEEGETDVEDGTSRFTRRLGVIIGILKSKANADATPVIDAIPMEEEEEEEESSHRQPPSLLSSEDPTSVLVVADIRRIREAIEAEGRARLHDLEERTATERALDYPVAGQRAVLGSSSSPSGIDDVDFGALEGQVLGGEEKSKKKKKKKKARAASRKLEKHGDDVFLPMGGGEESPESGGDNDNDDDATLSDLERQAGLEPSPGEYQERITNPLLLQYHNFRHAATPQEGKDSKKKKKKQQQADDDGEDNKFVLSEGEVKKLTAKFPWMMAMNK